MSLATGKPPAFIDVDIMDVLAWVGISKDAVAVDVVTDVMVVGNMLVIDTDTAGPMLDVVVPMLGVVILMLAVVVPILAVVVPMLGVVVSMQTYLIFAAAASVKLVSCKRSSRKTQAQRVQP